MSIAYHCDIQLCGVDPLWTLTRVGDALVTWACDDHLLATLHRIQRLDEETEVIVKYRWDALSPDEGTEQ